MPFADVKPDDPHWEAIQRVGLTGLLKGTGKSGGWANKMFFYPDSNANALEFLIGAERYAGNHLFYRGYHANEYYLLDFFNVLRNFRPYLKTEWFKKISTVNQLKESWANWGLGNFKTDRIITRREMCVMLDKSILLFNNRNLPMDLTGELSFVHRKF
jgi:hypothetical protein